MDAQTANHLLVSLLVKPLLMLALLGMLYGIIRKQSAAFKHFVLLLGILGLLTIPILAAVLPGIDWHRLPWVGDLALAMDQHLLAWMQLLPSWFGENVAWLLGIYFLVALWIFYYRALGWIALAYQSRRAQEVTDTALCEQRDQLCELLEIQRKVSLKIARDINSPQMWGDWHPVILLPREALLWEPDKQLSVLLHELGHVARRDWLSSQVVAMTCAVFWFLPPLWWLANTLYDQAEMACDDLIYRLRDKHLAYAQSLLQLAGGETPVSDEPVLGIRGHSAIYWRIHAVLDKRRPRQPVAMESGQYWFLSAAFILVFTASIQIIPLQPVPGLDESRREEIPLPLDVPAAVAEEQFDWQHLARLRQVQTPVPAPIPVEEIHIRVEPAAFVTQESMALERTPLNRPVIQVQGYLPIQTHIPEYPPTALARGLEGRVVVEFTIDTAGNIQDPQIIERPDTYAFDKTVLSAIKKSRYQPQMFDGQPVILRGVTEEFIFRLEDPAPKRRR
ncbi:M56 family metallopeptidase [Cellvibrio japonicus]|uniref:Peptidase, M56 family n=1 Tax=Cellvibrio japonicus (strain Ueda107) TaxID=498211 RepID=B3PLF7_CELJU|nr:M56 family metallopeptidase [Cellvibrio japonicus]ACE86221.1 peptidase, M56 family [Cellvibrio japonicus Ueda107]QEI11609.1 TonB family protein [Cellvibrio japonicus]QEI15183.1 TonB family protein [Cellvibrio japonicus]QEI18763.1 TonB family protein [Cellvibrio japonicus]